MPTRAIRGLYRSMFDIRTGEGPRLFFMSLYLLWVLFAYYILKAASKAMFLDKFDIEKLPYLQILIAGAGGVIAFLYTKLAVQSSLRRAVDFALASSAVCLIAFWWFLPHRWPWMLYVFNVWVSMFSIVTVSQGYLVASYIFDPRQAKRLYGLLGLGSVAGAYFGSVFTKYAAKPLGTTNLLWGSVVGVAFAWVAFALLAAQKGVRLSSARAAAEEPVQFGFREIPSALSRHRHLQVIVGIILLMLTINSFVDYQFSAMAKVAHKGDALTAFLGSYNTWLTIIEFIMQFFLTSITLSAIGVGGTLQVMPVTMASAAVLVMAVPTLLTTVVARLAEAVSRYTLNKTGLELLYLPLPTDLRSRTKAFVDISMDRFGRGFGGVLLLVLIQLKFNHPWQIAMVTLSAALLWVLLAAVARKEYVQTVRKRLEARRLDLEEMRIKVDDPETLGILENALGNPSPRQVVYALGLLAAAPGYDLRPRLAALKDHASPDVRGKVFELARQAAFDGALDSALKEVWASAPGQDGPVRNAVSYILSQSAEARELTKLFLDHPNWVVAESALEAMQREAAEDFVTNEWLAAAAGSADPHRRSVAALAVGVRGDQGTEVLFRLLSDPDPAVAAAACRAAGSVRNRAYVPALVQWLADARVRAAAIEALAAFGAGICGALGDMLHDANVPVAARRHIPRVLRLIPEQRSANVLLGAIAHPDLTIRVAALKALNRLRQTAPELDYGRPAVTRQILDEARHCYGLHAALAPLQAHRQRGTAAALLARTIEQRLAQTLERLFRLLGLRYPPRQIYAAYVAVNRGRAEEFTAALEFLDNVVDRDLKRVVLPLLDTAASNGAAARAQFGVEPLGAEAAVRELIRSGDPWVKACAIATAAEQSFRGLREDIAAAAEHAGADVTQVARAAAAALR